MSTDYDAKLKWGLKWERIIAKLLMLHYYSEQVYIIISSYIQQVIGSDIEVGKKRKLVEIKTREYSVYRYRDILIETIANAEKEVQGWWYTSKAEKLVYTWVNKNETAVHDGYEINMQDPNLRKWFEENKYEFEQKETSTMKTGVYHTTVFRLVPIKSFPPGTIKHIPIFEVKKSQLPPKMNDARTVFGR